MADCEDRGTGVAIMIILFCLVILGVGKTTLVCGVCAALQERREIAVQGFYTQEVRGAGAGGRGRGRGPRIGFDVVTFSGKRGPLARVAE